MGYQIERGSDTEYEVRDYPSFAEERELHRLIARTDPDVAPANREQIHEMHGWEEVDIEITDRVEYHLELAKVIFEGEVEVEDPDNLLPGKIQEARVDFIAGCQGRSGGQGGSSMQALAQMARSLVGQSDPTTETTSNRTTERP